MSGTDRIGEDFRPGNSELEAWSMLYYRYVRVDLDLSIEQLETLTRQDRRTLSRRQSRGLLRLTHALIRQEMRSRTRRQVVALRARLPFSQPPALIGRAALLERVLHWLIDAPNAEHAETDGPRHVQLRGAPGVGKSVLALAAAHRLIDLNRVDNLLWLEISTLEGGPDRILEQIVVGLGLPLTESLTDSLGADLFPTRAAYLSAYLQNANGSRAST